MDLWNACHFDFLEIPEYLEFSIAYVVLVVESFLDEVNTLTSRKNMDSREQLLISGGNNFLLKP